MPGEPVSTLIVFCDYVIVEAKTGKISLIGTFSRLVSQRFPFQVPKVFIHTTISNYIPSGKESHIVVNLKQAKSGAVVGSAAMPLNVPIPTTPIPSSGMHINLNIPFQNVVFHSPGPYICEILFDGDPIGNRTLEVELRPNQPPPQQPVQPPQQPAV
jgi:hypothetical protein